MENYTIDGVIVYISDNANDVAVLRKIHGFLGFATKVKDPRGSSVLYDGVVLLKEDLDRVPKNVKEFVTWHEIGHIKNGHIKDALTKRVKRKFKNECSADEYALKHMPQQNIIIALESIISYMQNEHSISWKNAAYWEVKLRISNIHGNKLKTYKCLFMMYLMANINLKDIIKVYKMEYERVLDEKYGLNNLRM